MDPDPELHAQAGGRVVVVHGLGDIDREIRHTLEVVRVPDRHTADDHVGVADRLDLFQVARIDQGVEHAEHLVKEPNELLGIHRARHRREPDDVCEEQRDVLVAVGDEPLTRADPVGDGLREDVEQQLEVLLVGCLELTLGCHVGAVDVGESEFGNVDRQELEVAPGTVDVDRSSLPFLGCGP